MPHITRLKLKNFKRFQNLDISFHNGRNILVGNNASGKSTILQAIDLCLSANRHAVEDENLKFLFNTTSIAAFKALPVAQRTLANLPHVVIEIFLEDCEIPEFVGANNSEGANVSGMKLRLEPDASLGVEINNIISSEGFSFPFEFYRASFTGFSGNSYSRYSCPIGHLAIDHTSIGAITATNNFVRKLFNSLTTSTEKNSIAHRLRQSKETFNNDVLRPIIADDDTNFVLRSDKFHTISHSVSIEKGDVDIMHEGKGEQSFVKTKFALERRTDDTHVLLIEEPENHLSHSGMMKLIDIFDEHHEGQTIISTHSSLIASGLRLSNLLIVGGTHNIGFSLSDLDSGTETFFTKAPDHLLLEFVLSNKVLLVEGSAEYILLPTLYQRAYLGRTLEADGIHIISVGGIKFKRYLPVSTLLTKRVAVIQDNDGNAVADIRNQYLNEDDDENSILDEEHHRLCLHADPALKTLEEVLYDENQELLDELFGGRARTNTVLQYMLANKTKVALELAQFLEANPGRDFTIPEYINQAFAWLQG